MGEDANGRLSIPLRRLSPTRAAPREHADVAMTASIGDVTVRELESGCCWDRPLENGSSMWTSPSETNAKLAPIVRIKPCAAKLSANTLLKIAHLYPGKQPRPRSCHVSEDAVAWRRVEFVKASSPPTCAIKMGFPDAYTGHVIRYRNH